jgi:hypothetical protein
LTLANTLGPNSHKLGPALKKLGLITRFQPPFTINSAYTTKMAYGNIDRPPPENICLPKLETPLQWNKSISSNLHI